MNLKDNIVIITGGSRGFGKALAGAFSAEKAKVIIASHDVKELEKVAGELHIDSVVTDVTSPHEVESLARKVFEKHGVIDIWINNAGIQIAPSKIEDVDTDKLHRLFDVNFFGYFYGCQTALRYMRKQKHGLIINVNSTAGLEGKADLSAYVSSKFAIKGLTESIRKETVGTGISVYAIYPGGMQTDIYKERYPDDIKEYMQVDDVVGKVIVNMKSDSPELDLVIKRPKL